MEDITNLPLIRQRTSHGGDSPKVAKRVCNSSTSFFGRERLAFGEDTVLEFVQPPGSVPSFSLNISSSSEIKREPRDGPTLEAVAGIPSPQLVPENVASLDSNLYDDSDFDITFAFSGVDLPLESDSEDEALEDKESLASVGEAKPSRFRPVDPGELANVMAGGKRRSKGTENWAENAFNEWRECNGYNTEAGIADLSEESDVKPLVEMLSMFMLQVNKKDGTMYPPTSIQGLLRGLGRIIRAREEERCVESSKKPRVACFNIMTDPRYHKVKLCGDEAVIRSSNAGLGRTVVQSDVLTLSEESLLLATNATSLNTASGINHRFVYFMTRDFFVRAGQELRQVEDNQFELGKDNRNEPFLRYIPRLAKNWKIDVLHCSTACQRNSVTCHDPDVILTFKTMFEHRPSFLPSEAGPHPLFLTPKSKLKKNDNVWFMKSAVGKNTLSNMTRDMAMEVDVLKNKRITNTTGRSVGISRMVDANVPIEKAMERTGHRSSKAFLQYDRTAKAINDRALSRIISGKSNPTVGFSYTSLYENERHKLQTNLINEAAMQQKFTTGCSQFDKHALGLSESDISSIAGHVIKALQKEPGTAAFATSCGGNEGGYHYSNLTNCSIIQIQNVDPSRTKEILEPAVAKIFQGVVIPKE